MRTSDIYSLFGIRVDNVAIDSVAIRGKIYAVLAIRTYFIERNSGFTGIIEEYAIKSIVGNRVARDDVFI
jgi:hypothetical protein